MDNTTTKTELYIKTSRAAMPNKCMGGNNYYRLAVIEVEKGAEPKMISTHARGVVRVIEVAEPLHMGITARSEYHRTLAKIMSRYPGARMDGLTAKKTENKLDR